MIRLRIDNISGLVEGYEYVDEANTYSDDILLSDDTDTDTLTNGILHSKNVFYRDGELQTGEMDSYRQTLSEIRARLASAKEKTENESQRLMDSLLGGTPLEQALEEAKANREELEAAQAEYDAAVAAHEAEALAHCKAAWDEKESGMEWKYYSSVCLLIRDENKYLEEWLEWHHALGVDHCYIYDNGVNEDVTDVVPEELADWVTVILWRDGYANAQTEAYNHFLANYGGETRWVNFVDSDEFIRMAGDTLLKDYLAENEAYTTIKVNFNEFNANGQENYENKPVRERFTQTTDIYAHLYHKDFIQPVRIDRMDANYPRYSNNGHYTLDGDKMDIIIDHYVTKSWEEWKEKMARGSCDPNRLRGADEFFAYNPDMAYLKDGDCTDQAYNAGEGSGNGG